MIIMIVLIRRRKKEEEFVQCVKPCLHLHLHNYIHKNPYWEYLQVEFQNER